MNTTQQSIHPDGSSACQSRADKSGITVIILTKNEQLHMRRCLERLRPLHPGRIVVVDSESTDSTAAIALAHGAEVVVHPWPGTQAEQFNWALDNLHITTPWILRLDADEYLTPGLIEELHATLPTLPPSVGGISLPLGRVFMNRELRHGVVPGINIIRIFRTGCACYEPRLMDEHLSLSPTAPGIHQACHRFIDHSLLPLADFIAKHNAYATREAALLLLGKYAEENRESPEASNLGKSVSRKRRLKSLYSKLPPFVRPFLYFFYRHFLRLGFLDGKEGFLWDFLQGWWYRTLVDAKVMEIEREAAAGSPTGKPTAESVRAALIKAGIKIG